MYQKYKKINYYKLMSFRIEEKLYIKKEHIFDFRIFLKKKYSKKMFLPRTISSLYFDNTNLDMYNDSIEGLVPRKKIRIRQYLTGDDKNLYLEIKNSSVEGRFKTRKVISANKFNRYQKIGIFDEQYGLCLPNCVVTYEREYSLINDVRISIDNNLRYKNFKTQSFFKDKEIIVELKTSIKKNLDDLIRDFPFQRTRFSKYCNGVEKMGKFEI